MTTTIPTAETREIEELAYEVAFAGQQNWQQTGERFKQGVRQYTAWGKLLAAFEESARGRRDAEDERDRAVRAARAAHHFSCGDIETPCTPANCDIAAALEGDPRDTLTDRIMLEDTRKLEAENVRLREFAERQRKFWDTNVKMSGGQMMAISVGVAKRVLKDIAAALAAARTAEEPVLHQP